MAATGEHCDSQAMPGVQGHAGPADELPGLLELFEFFLLPPAKASGCPAKAYCPV